MHKQKPMMSSSYFTSVICRKIGREPIQSTYGKPNRFESKANAVNEKNHVGKRLIVVAPDRLFIDVAQAINARNAIAEPKKS